MEGGNCRVQQFTGDGGFVMKWGTCGSGDGQFSGPHSIAIDGQGNIYVGDGNNGRIQKFGPGPTPTLRATWGRVKALYR